MKYIYINIYEKDAQSNVFITEVLTQSEYLIF